MQTYNGQFYEFFNNYIDSFELEPTLKAALKYSFDSNGKLFRPMLMWTMLEDLKVQNQYYEVALAIEMIHTYSLVHDDLPAMDNDDYRRGKLTSHKMFGEDIAILTGDGLLTQAFDLLAKVDLDPKVVVALIQSFTEAAGISGMIGGQVMDVKNENDPHLTVDTLKIIHDKKTAMMIELPIKCAQLIAGTTDSGCLQAARKLGLFYQIQDDYLDTYGDFTKMGKSSGADDAKVTYSTLYTKQELEAYIQELGSEILEAYAPFPSTQRLVKTIIQREG
ncbi:polyprenyl synthetase family protein [Mollicutes bacterium LVI A0039]|nr:polyprenyl synthetase family protein [Mollicutes bacterium LVI A0039]